MFICRSLGRHQDTLQQKVFMKKALRLNPKTGRNELALRLSLYGALLLSISILAAEILLDRNDTPFTEQPPAKSSSSVPAAASQPEGSLCISLRVYLEGALMDNNDENAPDGRPLM